MKQSQILALLVVVTALARAEAPIEKSSQLPEIIMDQASAEIFPESWRTPKVNAKAALLEASQLERCRDIVNRALSKYPADMLKTTLKKIYCLGRLEYSGAVTGGTRSSSAIYVVCTPTYTPPDVERIIHAEYSSVLFKRYAHHFDAEAWQQINPPGFKYLGSGVLAVKSGQASRRSSPTSQEQGFVHEYAKASIEEDFNSHAAALFMGDEKHWESLQQRPKLKAKSDLVMTFYAKVHPSLTRIHFQVLRTKEPH